MRNGKKHIKCKTTCVKNADGSLSRIATAHTKAQLLEQSVKNMRLAARGNTAEILMFRRHAL